MFRYSTTLEKHKLFISGLPFSCTKEELEGICKAHGTVKDLRLVTNRAGKPKVRGQADRGPVAGGGSTFQALSQVVEWESDRKQPRTVTHRVCSRLLQPMLCLLGLLTGSFFGASAVCEA